MKSMSMRFLIHHLYEYRKGVRRLFMMTLSRAALPPIEARLIAEGIAYYLHEVSSAKVNVFFGHSLWIETVRTVVTKPLCRLSPEEDFMLGTLLGYDGEQQCQRFLDRDEGRRMGRPAVAVA